MVKNPPGDAGGAGDKGLLGLLGLLGREGDKGLLGREDPLEEEMTTHSSILAWRIPWTEGPGGLQSTGSQRIRHN